MLLNHNCLSSACYWKCHSSSKTVQVPVYSEQEYQMYLHDDGWTKAETDHLFDLCKRFDLRFVVIHDRYDHQQYRVNIFLRFCIIHAVCIKLIWTVFLFFFFVETICWGSQGTLLQHLWQVNKGSGRNRDRAKDLHIWRWSWETQERAARQVIQPHSWAGETLSESTTAAQN